MLGLVRDAIDRVKVGAMARLRLVGGVGVAIGLGQCMGMRMGSSGQVGSP